MTTFQTKAGFLFLTLLITLACAKQDPQEQLRHCIQQQCRQQTRLDDWQKWLCAKACERQIYGDSDTDQNDRDWDSDESWNENPYVFKDEHFKTQFRSNEGRVRVLPKFTERSSKLFKGIQNYRVLFFEARPQTFIVPSHWDADVIFFVAQGRGTITLVFTDRRESYNIQQGHVMIIPAGVTAYLINRDENQKLVLAKLLNPVSNPGRFEAFFSGSSQNAESYFNGFSPEVLEAVFQTTRSKLERIFAPRSNEGLIRSASEEQIRALTHDDNTHWPFSGKSSSKDYSPLNLFNHQRRDESNQYGNLFIIDTEDNAALKDLGLAVSFANITQGAMHTIYYNSRATKISVVVNGRGKLEMAVPQVAQSGDQQRHHDSGRSRQGDQSDTGRSRQGDQSDTGRSRQWDETDTRRSRQGDQSESGRSRQREESETPIEYKKLTSELKPGTVFIVPPGHPYVAIASQNDNLQIFCFEVNAQYNHKVPLAGNKNVLKNIEKVAKQLTYGSSADEVDSVFNKRNEDFFLPGPRQQRRHPDFSIV